MDYDKTIEEDLINEDAWSFLEGNLDSLIRKLLAARREAKRKNMVNVHVDHEVYEKYGGYEVNCRVRGRRLLTPQEIQDRKDKEEARKKEQEDKERSIFENLKEKFGKK